MTNHARHPRSVVLGLVLAVGVLSGCKDLLDVELPAQLTDEVLTDPRNAAIIVNSFIGHWEFAWDKQVYWNFGREAGGEVHLCGPCGYSDYQTASPVWASNAANDPTMAKSLRFSRDLWNKLDKEWDVKAVPDRARFMALASLYQGMGLMWAGSTLCEVALDGGKKLTAAETLTQAEAMLTRALGEIAAMPGGDFAVMNGIATSAKTMAYGLRAQTRYMIGNLPAAAQDAALVPNGFNAWNTREGGEARQNFGWYSGTSGSYMEMYDPIDWWKSPIPNPANNQVWPAIIPFTGWTYLGILPDGRAVRDDGIPIRTAAGPAPWNNAIGVTAGAVPDTRVKQILASITGKGGNGILPGRYTGEDSDEPLVNWKEMLLIRAEAAGGQAAIDFVNQIRTADNLPKVTYANPANAQQIRYMILEEKRRSLFEEGRFFYTMLRNLDVMWFPRDAGGTRYKVRRLQGGVRWIMAGSEYTDNRNLTLADRATGCGPAEKPVGSL